MYGLYDTDGILRFVNSDIDACLAYADLFGLDSKNYSLMPLLESSDKDNKSNLHLNQAKNNN